jgi:hypothetical protein
MSLKTELQQARELSVAGVTDGVVVHESDGPKRPDGTPLDGR